jgi:hypothetical protein
MKSEQDIINYLRPIIEEHGPDYMIEFNYLCNFEISFLEYVEIHIPFKSKPEFRRVNNIKFYKSNDPFKNNLPENCDDFFCLTLHDITEFSDKWNYFLKLQKMKAFL